MATIRKRGSSWQVQVRRDGYPQISETFKAKADAVAWAREQERSMDRGEQPQFDRSLMQTTLGDLLKRYGETITPRKRGAGPETYRLRTLMAHRIAKLSLSALKPNAIVTYREDRLAKVQPGTVRREMAILQHCLEIARREWGYPIRPNPMDEVSLPSPQRARDRRLNPGEAEKLAAALAATSAPYLRPFIILAIETGMRRGELLSIRWADLNLYRRTLLVQTTKNGHPRTIPLTPQAVETLRALPREGDQVFNQSANATRLAWERLRKRAGLDDLRMHDLRHEAVSRFFEYGLSAPEVALISGHRDARMLFRYTHLRPEAVGKKLDVMTETDES